MHAGTGGVGLAAIQVATSLGCRLLVSAGSPAKRSTLHGMGIATVVDSRSTAFAESLALATSGTGVDLLLNSLTSPGMVAASLASLTPGGRFVEISKRDIWSAARISQGEDTLPSPAGCHKSRIQWHALTHRSGPLPCRAA